MFYAIFFARVNSGLQCKDVLLSYFSVQLMTKCPVGT